MYDLGLSGFASFPVIYFLVKSAVGSEAQDKEFPCSIIVISFDFYLYMWYS